MTKNFIEYNANPEGNNTNDCSVRALAKFLGISWADALMELAIHSTTTGWMPNKEGNISSYMQSNGFEEWSGEGLTVNQLCNFYSNVMIYAITRGHAVCIEDGKYFDTWDSGRRKVITFWVKEDIAA